MMAIAAGLIIWQYIHTFNAMESQLHSYQQLEKRLIALGCPNYQLLVRKENIDVQSFYEQLGYEEIEVVCFGKRLIAD